MEDPTEVINSSMQAFSDVISQQLKEVSASVAAVAKNLRPIPPMPTINFQMPIKTMAGIVPVSRDLLRPPLASAEQRAQWKRCSPAGPNAPAATSTVPAANGRSGLAVRGCCSTRRCQPMPEHMTTTDESPMVTVYEMGPRMRQFRCVHEGMAVLYQTSDPTEKISARRLIGAMGTIELQLIDQHGTVQAFSVHSPPRVQEPEVWPKTQTIPPSTWTAIGDTGIEVFQETGSNVVISVDEGRAVTCPVPVRVRSIPEIDYDCWGEDA